MIVEGEASQRHHVDDVVPDEVQRFVLDRIDSIAQLEALLMMRNAPDSWWPSSTMAERLYIAEKTCRVELEALRDRGLLLAKEDTVGLSYRYRPSTGFLSTMAMRMIR